MVLAIVQARMTSSRLPGKVLEPILGVPMIGRQIERLQRTRSLDPIVVATSTDARDDVLAAYVESLDVPVFRGPLEDVLLRYVAAIDEFPSDVVVRLTADCPLASPTVIDRVVSAFESANVDYASNTLRPTYPNGVEAEVVTTDALRWVCRNSDDPHEHEHVTLGVYRRPDRFSLANVESEEDHSELRWTVDVPADLAFVRAVFQILYASNPEFEMQDVLRVLAQRPNLIRTCAHERRNAALDGLDTGAMEHDRRAE